MIVKGGMWIRSGEGRLGFQSSLDVEGYGEGDREGLLKRVREAITGGLGEAARQ